MLNLKALLTKILPAITKVNTFTSTTPAITTTKGTVSSLSARTYGPIMNIGFRVKNSSQVSAGGDICTATLTTTALLPRDTVQASNYYGIRPIIATLRSDGTITVRNASNSNLSANSEVSIEFIYIAKTWAP